MSKVRKVFPVEGMHCAGCALHVEEALRGCAGVEAAGVNLTNGRAWAVFEEGTGCEERMRQAVENAGYELDISGRRDEGGGGEAVRGARWRFLVALCGALVVMVLGWVGGMRAAEWGWRRVLWRAQWCCTRAESSMRRR